MDDEEGEEGVVVGGPREVGLVGAEEVEEEDRGFEGGGEGRVEEAVEGAVVEDQEGRVGGRGLEEDGQGVGEGQKEGDQVLDELGEEDWGGGTVKAGDQSPESSFVDS